MYQSDRISENDRQLPIYQRDRNLRERQWLTCLPRKRLSVVALSLTYWILMTYSALRWPGEPNLYSILRCCVFNNIILVM